MKKNIITCIQLCLLTTVFYNSIYASDGGGADSAISEKSIDEKIKETDEQIRKKEQLLQSNGSDIQKLVDQYNALIQERATKADAKIMEPTEQRTEDAIIERLKTHENRIDILEKEVATLKALVQKIVPSTAVPEEKKEEPISDQKASAAQPDIKTIDLTTSAPKAVSDTPPVSTTHIADTKATEEALKSPIIPSINTKSPALAQYNQAMALINEGTVDAYTKATKAFEFIIQSYPDDEYANKSYLHAGDAYANVGKLDDAKRCYKAAITKLLPAHSIISARLGLADVYVKQADKEKAAEQIKMLKREKFTEDQRNRFDRIKHALMG